MIICDNCKKEIKPRESRTYTLIDKRQRHYCKNCSPTIKSGWIVLGIVLFILFILLLVFLVALVSLD